MKTILTALIVLSLTGCAALQQQAEERQRQQEQFQEMLAQMTPSERANYLLNVQRLQIEQQRANQEQVESGLRMMQQSQPHPLNCLSTDMGGIVQTTCN